MIPVDLNNLEILQDFRSCLGSGIQGQVYPCTNKVVVVKLYVYIQIGPAFQVGDPVAEHQLSCFKNEEKIYRRIGTHPYIVHFLGMFPGPHIGLVLERVHFGALVSSTTGRKGPCFTEQPLRLRLNWLCQLADALSYIHSKSIIHGDVQLTNILWADTHDIKLSDFGGSSVDGSSYGSSCGAPFARRLRQYQQQPHTMDDIFAVGTVAYTLFAGCEPLFDMADEQERAKMWHTNEYFIPPSHADLRVSKIMVECWNERYTSALALSSALCALWDCISTEPLLDDPEAFKPYRQVPPPEDLQRLMC